VNRKSTIANSLGDAGIAWDALMTATTHVKAGVNSRDAARPASPETVCDHQE
jgi:hypothetical protein